MILRLNRAIPKFSEQLRRAPSQDGVSRLAVWSDSESHVARNRPSVLRFSVFFSVKGRRTDWIDAAISCEFHK